MMVQNNDLNQQEVNISIIKDFINISKKQWKWYLFSVCICLSLTFLYISVKQPVYERTVQIMIKQDSDPTSRLSAGLGMIQGMGLLGGGITSNVNNELAAIQTPSVIMETLKRLQINYTYYTQNFLRKHTLYGNELPIIATINDLQDNDFAYIKLHLQPKGKFTITSIKKNKQKNNEPIVGYIGKAVNTPIGTVSFTKGTGYKGNEDETIMILHTPLYKQIDAIQKKISAGLFDELGSVIDISYEDVSPERAEAFLNTMIEVYNEQWINDKNGLTAATINFIDDRIESVTSQLGMAESNLMNYKAKNGVPDIIESTKMAVINTNEAAQKIALLRNQKTIAIYIRDYLKDNSNENQLLPANLINTDKGTISQIADYNELQLKRNKLVQNSNETNAIVKELDTQLATMRESILSALDNTVKQIGIQIKGIEDIEQQNKNEITSTPNKAKYLLSAERNQKILEELYIFLLQKREENIMSTAFRAFNTRILTPPIGDVDPIKPRAFILMGSFFVLGLAIPALIFLLLCYIRLGEKK